MNSYIAFGFLLIGSVLVESRPQGYSVDCQRREVAPGQWAFTCAGDGRSGDAPTINTEHVLWIQQEGGQAQSLDVEIPNYKLEELIKAGFKGGSAGETKVNILLKKPEQSYNAEVDKPESVTSAPSVNVQYEPVEALLVHYPNDKAYRPVSAPILPPGSACGDGVARC